MCRWARKVLASGLFEPAPHSKRASRVHLALKAKRGQPKDSPDFDIRAVGDYVMQNEDIERLQPNQPHAMDQVRHAAGHHAYFYTDGMCSYHGWELHEDDRDTLAVWTPIGLIRPNRLVFGE